MGIRGMSFGTAFAEFLEEIRLRLRGKTLFRRWTGLRRFLKGFGLATAWYRGIFYRRLVRLAGFQLIFNFIYVLLDLLLRYRLLPQNQPLLYQTSVPSLGIE
jgi:hypothetical protein